MQTQEVIEGWRGVAVSMGLSSPMSRAITATVMSGAVFYALGYPAHAFTPQGSMRPHASLSADPNATRRHFILTPLMVGGAVALFT